MTDLPQGWARASIEALASDTPYALAIGPFGSNLKVIDYQDNGVPLIFVRNIRARRFSDTRYVSPEKAEELNAHLVRAGDVLVTKMGDPPGDATVYPAGRPEAVITADCIKITPAPFVDARFLAVAIETPAVRRQILGITKGVAQKKVSLTRFKSVTIPLPPLAEQRRIVAAIEEHLSRLDAAQRSLERSEANLERLRTVTFRDIFRGGWPTERLEALTDPERPIRYGILMPKEHIADGVLYVRVKDYPNGRVDLAGLRRTSPEIAHQYRRATLRAGDVLLAIRGTYGRVAIVPPELDGGNITQDTARIAPLAQVDAEYLAAYLTSDAAQRYFRHVARGVAVKGVNIRDLRVMPIPIPPLEEQRRIVAEVERQLSLIDALREGIASAQRRCALLRAGILARAFRGELVPRDPNDEPASALLERVAAERAAAPKAARRRREKTPA